MDYRLWSMDCKPFAFPLPLPYLYTALLVILRIVPYKKIRKKAKSDANSKNEGFVIILTSLNA